MRLFGSDTNSGMNRTISDWFRINFNPKLSPVPCLYFGLERIKADWNP